MKKINVCIITLSIMAVFALLISIKPISNAISDGFSTLITQSFMESVTN